MSYRKDNFLLILQKNFYFSYTYILISRIILSVYRRNIIMIHNANAYITDLFKYTYILSVHTLLSIHELCVL